MLDETLKQARILIVDDQEANVEVLVSLLGMTGYTRLASTTYPQQVVTLFGEFQPDLILLDLMMPHLDGFQVMEQLRPRIPPSDYLPIVMLTADITPETKRRALNEGAKDFLTKPLDLTEVTLRIKNLLETRALHGALQNQNKILEETVRARTTALQRQIQQLDALRIIDNAIMGTLDLRLALNVVLEQTLAQLQADAASVLLLNPHTQTLTYTAGRGFRTRAIEQSRVRLGEGFSSKSILERQVVHLHDPARSLDFTRATLLAGEDFIEYYAAPLFAKGHNIGVLEVFHRAPYTADTEWRVFLETLAGQAAIAVDNAQLFESLQRANAELFIAYDATIEGWSRAMDLRDKETEGHTQRVTEMTERLARAQGIDDERLIHIRRGALLHDMGKMGVPDDILLKPGKLTDEEWVIMRQHPQYAFDMLAPIAYLKPALDIPYCHHEKWDGTGYPRGLKGEQIPLAARLFAVVDVWDALRSDRPYRQGWPEEKVLEHIRALAGTHFDPQAVELFLRVMSEKTQGVGQPWQAGDAHSGRSRNDAAPAELSADC